MKRPSQTRSNLILELCSGDCLEFGTHLKAASAFVKQRGSDGTERGFFQQRLAWYCFPLAACSFEAYDFTG